MNDEKDLCVLVEYGSNATKVMTASCSTGEENSFYRLPLRLADRLDESGCLTEDAIAIMLNTIIDVKKRFPNAQEYLLIGTEALRRARNKQEIIDRIAHEHGLSLRILSTQEEAEAAFLGVRDLIPKRKRAVCFDIGGSSTEIVKVYGGKIESINSFKLGAVDLSRNYSKTMPLKNCAYMGMLFEIDKILRWKVPGSCNVIGTGGSVHTCASVAARKAGMPNSGIEGFRLLKGELFRQIQMYRALDLTSIARIPGMEPARVDTILPAVMIMHHILEQTDQPYLVATCRGVRHGILMPK
jgi:exopolyphosphatase/guanosine-5'-triphosphate,3'-diphosphate pyrophosphatase